MHAPAGYQQRHCPRWHRPSPHDREPELDRAAAGRPDEQRQQQRRSSSLLRTPAARQASVPPGMQVAAAVHPIAMVTISDDDNNDAGNSVQRPAVVNGSLHACNEQWRHRRPPQRTATQGRSLPGRLSGLVQIVVAEFECLLVCTLLAGGGGILDHPYDPNSNEHYFIALVNTP